MPGGYAVAYQAVTPSHNRHVLRDPALIPLSQQHHNGLALCILTERALAADRSPATIARLAQKAIDRYEIELSNHFGIEEELLFPLIERELGATPAVAELIADHRALEHMIDQMRSAPSVELLEGFWDLLRRHIRREENELFQDVQGRLPKDALAAAGKEIDARAIRVCL
jgi:hemerythrin-like domain-containing protein